MKQMSGLCKYEKSLNMLKSYCRKTVIIIVIGIVIEIL